MSEANKAPRPMKDIEIEYAQVCTRLGDISYRIAMNKKDQETLTAALQTLNLEAAAAQRATAEAVKASSTEVSSNG